ncbi:hypothetical protein [Methylobacterium nodulans]|uniref:Uncharacterized protein n=1 Tax=Methylobacterium nodulans (strain LMG 21967 / CNCM I-2342 / ORS 2060) TaxID=460265 RepID=B8ILC8_METNO|nr:hypothetical protein [Methylobacterium nodulans]ACL60127.1 conserved hypothetical protein [Methylobacterium nodulans ORS 2060]
MKAFAVAVIMAVALAAGAAFVLTSNQKYAYEAFATSGARVSNPGTNLVGPHWTGNVTEPAAGLKTEAAGS